MNTFQEMSKKARVSSRKAIKESDKFYEDDKEINIWVRKFQDKFGYIAEFQYGEGNAWLDRVGESHLNLRRKIKGISQVVQHDLKNLQKPISIASASRFYDKIRRLVPKIDNHYYGPPPTRASFTQPYGGPKGMKLTKYIASHADTLKGEKRKELDKILEELGQKWSNTKTKEVTLYSRLDTSAKAFILLGHYEVDNISCFKQGGANPGQKFTLGQKDNTFVFIVRSDDNFTHNLIQEGNLCRMWGFYRPQDNAVNFCNLYVKDGFVRGNAVEACRQQSAKILGVDVDEVELVEDIISSQQAVVWHNQQAQNWTFYTGKEPEEQAL